MIGTENLMPLVKAVETATGHRPHLATCLRWTTKPNRHGIVLESAFLGGRRMTSVEAVKRFMERNSQASDCQTSLQEYQTPRQLRRKADKAASRLKEVLGAGSPKTSKSKSRQRLKSTSSANEQRDILAN